MPIFKHAPCYEAEVFILFGLLLDHMKKYGMDISIKECSGEYPDCILIINDKEVKAEFEVYTSNFLVHKHDPRLSNIIICWENDLEQPPLDVLELKKIVLDLEKSGIKLFETYLECPLYRLWNEELFFKVLKEKTNEKVYNLVRDLYEYIINISQENPNFGIRYGTGKKTPTIDLIFKNITHNVIIDIGADGKASINYSTNITLPPDVEQKLREIFGEYKRQWHLIDITEENVNKIKKAIKFLLSYK